jgi:hypothetical protein
VEGDLLGLDLAVLHVDLVSNKDDGNVFADANEILVPLGHVLVGDAGAHIEHNDGAVSANATSKKDWLDQFSLWRNMVDLLVAVTETSEFLLAGGVPHVEADGTVVGVEDHGVHLDTEGGDVLLLELTSEMSLDEGGLTDTTITDEDELVLSDNWSRL